MMSMWRAGLVASMGLALVTGAAAGYPLWALGLAALSGGVGLGLTYLEPADDGDEGEG